MRWYFQNHWNQWVGPFRSRREAIEECGRRWKFSPLKARHFVRSQYELDDEPWCDR